MKSTFVNFAIFVLLYYFGFGFLLAIILIIKNGDNDTTWFSRMFLALVCLGFAGVISAIKQLKETK